jgi:hypothetical protein
LQVRTRGTAALVDISARICAARSGAAGCRPLTDISAMRGDPATVPIKGDAIKARYAGKFTGIFNV